MEDKSITSVQSKSAANVVPNATRPMPRNMIVDSMNYKEVIDLFRKDLPLVNHKMEEASKRLHKVLKNFRNKERLYYKPIEFKGNRGFNYVIQYFNRGVDVPTAKRLGVYYYTWFIYRGGTYAMILSVLESSVWHFNIITAHFLDRYRERFLKDKSISKQDVISHFIKNNLKVEGRVYASEKYPNSYWTFCNDGLCLCNRYDHFMIEMKTFISRDMAGVDQRQAALEAKEAMNIRGFDLALPENEFD